MSALAVSIILSYSSRLVTRVSLSSSRGDGIPVCGVRVSVFLMARSLRKNDSAMLMYSLAVCVRDTVLPPAHAAAVNSFRLSCASFLVGGPMMRDLSAASSGSVRDRISWRVFSCLCGGWVRGACLLLGGHGGAGAVRWRIPGGGRDAGVGVCRFLLRIHPTDGRSSASCLCMKESIDGSNGLSWHPYAFVWRSSEGVRGNLRAGPTAWGASRCAAGVRDCCEPKRKNCAGGMRGFGSARRRDAWGGVGLRWRTRGGRGLEGVFGIVGSDM